MKTPRFGGSSWVFVLSLLLLVSCGAPRTDESFKPKPGLAGKDVIWVPTSPELVGKMLDMAGVTSQDFVIDLGSGDGRMVIAAAKRGARALGIEYNPKMVELARRQAAQGGVTERAQFAQADLFETDLSPATVITMFLLPRLNHQLRPKIFDLAPGTRVVSNSFKMGEWQPDATGEATDDCGSYCRAYLWIVPAKVAGTWSSIDGELRVAQEFQAISGTLTRDQKTVPIEDGRLHGSQISFTAEGLQYVGRVKDDAMEGVIRADGLPPRLWRAKRGG